MRSLERRAEELLGRVRTVVLASVTEEGAPRPVPVARIASGGFATVWAATAADSVKTAHFRRNPRAGLCFSDERDSVVLTGCVEVVTDPARKAGYWREWLAAHFPEGPADPNYVLLRFRGDRATFWIDGEFAHREIGKDNE